MMHLINRVERLMQCGGQLADQGNLHIDFFVNPHADRILTH
jgi:hypothetical protein